MSWKYNFSDRLSSVRTSVIYTIFSKTTGPIWHNKSFGKEDSGFSKLWTMSFSKGDDNEIAKKIDEIEKPPSSESIRPFLTKLGWIKLKDRSDLKKR